MNLSIELRGLGRGLLVSLGFCLLSAPVIYFTRLEETIMPAWGNLILAAGIFLCGCYVSKSYGSKGLVRGIAMGLTFFILMLITTFAFKSYLIDLKTFIYNLALCLAAGGLGGILGIGLSDKVI